MSQEDSIKDGDETPMKRQHSSSSTTPSGSPLFYSSGFYSTGSIDHIPIEKMSFLDLLDPVSSSSFISKKYTQVKEKSIIKFNKLKNDTNKKREKYITEISDVEGFKRKLKERVDKLDSRMNGLFYASATEKGFYSFALFTIFVAGFIIAKYPEYFHLYYTGLGAILYPIRAYTYWKKSYHYFLADLCYFVNLLLIIFIWFAPHSVHLYTVCFAFTFGTLSWAVITWRNSLVLHSIDKFTSSFIHILPPVVMFVITHGLDHDYKLQRFPGAAKLTSWNLVPGILWTSLYYLIWQSLYHYFITIRKAEKIKQGRVTSFEWLRKSMAKAWIGKFVNSLPDPYPVVAFTLIQYGYQLLTMSIVPIWFQSKILASLFLIFIFLVAAFNGATYYIDYYGKRFEKEVSRLKNEIAELQQSDFSAASSPVLEGITEKPLQEYEQKINKQE